MQRRSLECLLSDKGCPTLEDKFCTAIDKCNLNSIRRDDKNEAQEIYQLFSSVCDGGLA